MRTHRFDNLLSLLFGGIVIELFLEEILSIDALSFIQTDFDRESITLVRARLPGGERARVPKKAVCDSAPLC